MDSYLVADDVYRVPGGFGSSGENYGGILLKTNPPIIIGASGGKKFLENLNEAVTELGLDKKLYFYLPNLLWQEVVTIEEIVKQYPESRIHVHEDIANRIRTPRDRFFEGRHDSTHEEMVKYYSRKLPKTIDNIISVNKLSSFQADKTKILIIPYPGPHEGHMFVYSVNHRLLATGIALGLTPTSKRTYYLDFTGNVQSYVTSLDFLDQAKSDIIFSSYDEPYFTSQNKPPIIEMKNALEKDEEAILEILTNQNQNFSLITRKFKELYAESIRTEPYDRLDPIATLLRFHLNKMVENGKVISEKEAYRTV